MSRILRKHIDFLASKCYYLDKGSARCNWVFYAHVKKGRKTSGCKNRRQKGHKQQAFLGPAETQSFQGHEKPDLSCQGFGVTHSPGESESTSSGYPSGEPWERCMTTPPSLAGEKKTPRESPDPLLTLTSDNPSYTRQDCNWSADGCNFNETFITNNKAGSHFPETRQNNFRIRNDPRLLLTFSQDFLITHSGSFSDASILENPRVKRRTVLKVSLTDFVGLSDKICAKCRSRIYGPGVRKLSHTLCQDLSNQTKIILHRINLTHRSNRRDSGSRMNTLEITLKNSTGLSTDLSTGLSTDLSTGLSTYFSTDLSTGLSTGLSTDFNENVQDVYVNENLMFNNPCAANTSVKPLSDTEHRTLSKAQLLTKDHMIVGMKGAKEDKRKLPLLKMPKEIILPQKYNNEDDDLQDDETPEYPLQEGDIFFKQQVSEQESFKNQIQMEIAEQSRNVFSDFLTEFSYHEKQVLSSSKIRNVHNRTYVMNDRKQQAFLDEPKTSNLECVKWPDNVSGETASKERESRACVSREEHLTQKSLAEVSWLSHGVDISGCGLKLLSFASRVQLCDSSSDHKTGVIKNSSDSRIPEQKNSSCGLKNNSNDRQVETKNINDILNRNYTKNVEIISINYSKETSTCSKNIEIKNNNDEIMNSVDINSSNGGKQNSTDSRTVAVNNDSQSSEIMKSNGSIKDNSDNVGNKNSTDNIKNSNDSKLYEIQKSDPYPTSFTVESPSHYKLSYFHPQLQPPALIRASSDNVIQQSSWKDYFETYSQTKDGDYERNLNKSLFTKLPREETMSSNSPLCAGNKPTVTPEMALDTRCSSTGIRAGDEKDLNYQNDVLQQRQNDGVLDKLDNSGALNAPSRAESLKMYIRRKVTSPEETKSHEGRSSNNSGERGTVEMNKMDVINSFGNNNTGQNITYNIFHSRTDRDNNSGEGGKNTVNTMACGMRNENLGPPSKQPLVKLDQHLSQQLEKQGTSSIKGSDKIDTSQHTPAAIAETSMITKVQYSSRAQEMIECSARQNLSKKHSNVLQKVTINLVASSNSHSESLSFLDTPRETQVSPVPRQQVSKSRSREPIENTAAMSFNTKGHLSCEAALPGSTQKNISSSFPDTQISTLRTDPSSLFEVNNTGQIELQKCCMKGTTLHNVTTRQAEIGEINHGGNRHMCLTSDECRLPVTHNKDRENGHSASKRTAVNDHQDISYHTISTVQMNAINTLEITAKTADNSHMNATNTLESTAHTVNNSHMNAINTLKNTAKTANNSHMNAINTLERSAKTANNSHMNAINTLESTAKTANNPHMNATHTLESTAKTANNSHMNATNTLENTAKTANNSHMNAINTLESTAKTANNSHMNATNTLESTAKTANNSHMNAINTLESTAKTAINSHMNAIKTLEITAKTANNSHMNAIKTLESTVKTAVNLHMNAINTLESTAKTANNSHMNAINTLESTAKTAIISHMNAINTFESTAKTANNSHMNAINTLESTAKTANNSHMNAINTLESTAKTANNSHMNAINTLESTAKTANNSHMNAKSNQSSLSHEYKQLPIVQKFRTNVHEAAALVLSPKRRLYKRAGTMTAKKGPDSYDTPEAMMSQETERKAPKKRLKGTELFDNDHMRAPASSVSSTAAMVNIAGVQSTRKKQTPPSFPQKQNPIPGRAASASPRAVSSSAEHQSGGQPTIQSEAQFAGSPQLHERSTSVRTTPTGLVMGCQLPPATSALKFVSCNSESNLRETKHLVSEPPLSNMTDSRVSQFINKVTETSDHINANQTENRQLKLKLFSSPLTQASSAGIVVDQVNYHPNQSSSQKAYSPKGNITPALSPVLDPYFVDNLSPLILQSGNRSTNHYLPAEKGRKQIIDSLNNSNQYEQLSGKSSFSNTNSSKSEFFGRKTNSVNHPLQPSTSGGNNFSNTSVEKPHFDPLWENRPFKPHLPSETSVRNTAVSFHTPKPVEQKGAKRRCTKKYDNHTIFPLQGQVNTVNQQVPWSSIIHPADTVFYENMNMLRHAQVMQVARQNIAQQQTVDPSGKVKYPSWVKIPKEQTCNKNNTTVASKSLNFQLAPSSNSLASSEKGSHKLHHAHMSPSHGAFLNDSSAGSLSSGHNGKRSPREERYGQVKDSRNPSPPCEPLDLSPGTGQFSFYSDSAQQKYSESQNSYSQHCQFKLSGTATNVDRAHSSELHEHHALNSSSHHVHLQSHTKGNNRDMAAPRTQLLPMLKTSSTNSQPAVLSYTKPSVPHNKPTLSQSTLQSSNIPEEQNMHPNIRVHSEHSSSQVVSSPCGNNEIWFSAQSTTAVENVHSKPAISPEVSSPHFKPAISPEGSSPSERNELGLSAQTTTAVEQHIQNQSTHLAVPTSTQFKDCPVTTYSPITTTCLPNRQTIALTSSSVSNQSIVTQSSLTRPVVDSSTSDLTNEILSSDSESVDGVTAVLSSHVLCSSVSLTTSRQTINRTLSDRPSLPSVLQDQTHNMTGSSVHYLPRVVPLPIKDFFTQTPKENAYSSLLMAEITSKSKGRLGLQKCTPVLPPAQAQNKIDVSTFEVSNSLQRKLMIDLTEDIDDCEVVSISSNDSLDDDSRIDFLDLTMRDRVPTPGSVTASSSISEAATVIEGNKHLQSTPLPSELTNISVRADLHSDFSDVEVITPIYISDSCQVHDTYGRQEKFTFNKPKFSYDNISNTADDTTDTYKTVECQIQPSSADLVVTHPLSKLDGSASFQIPKRRPTAENSAPQSDVLKIVPEFKDMIAKKLLDAVASRPSCGRLPSRDFMAPAETTQPENVPSENQQQHIMNSPPHPASIKVSTHDNSTQRAAATLLELSANPLYNPYTIRPETSDDYQEKVYLVHPTLEDSEIDRQDSIRATQKATEKSRGRSGRRVGRPPKNQLHSDTADSEENKTMLSDSSNSYTSSNSAPSTCLVTTSTCTNTGASLASPGYVHTSRALPINCDDDGVQFVRINTVNNLSHDQTSGYSSSKTKRRQMSTENQNGKRPRRISIEEDTHIIEEPDNETSMETDNMMSNIESTIYKSNIESPTFQGPLHFIIGNDKVNPDNTSSSVAELGNNLTENEIRNKCKRKRMKPQSKKKHSNQQESFISDIEKVLQQLNSKETVATIVAKTSFEHGLHVLSVHSETESDFSHQSPQNGDQIVPVNLAHPQDSWVTSEINPCKTSTPNGNTAIMISQPLPQQLITDLVNSELRVFHNSTEQAAQSGDNEYENNTLDNEAAKEIEKEQAVTSMLAEMMHSRIKVESHL